MRCITQKVLCPRNLICLGLAAATFVVYGQVYSHGLHAIDDSVYVGDNPIVRDGLTGAGVAWAFTTTEAANWHPITWVSHMLDFQVFGDHFGGHHLVNLLFHVLNVLLLFWVFQRMTGTLGASAFVAAVFAVHPLHVESVAWISERKDVLSTFFWLLTMAAYLGYVKKPGAARYLLILPLFAMGLMAKPMLVTLPCVLLLLDYWPLGRLASFPSASFPNGDLGTRVRGKSRRHEQPKPKPHFPPTRGCNPLSPWKVLIEKLPLFGLSALSSLMTFYAQQYSGAVQTLDMLPFHHRVANAIVVCARYVFHALWPVGLSTYYPLPETGLPWWHIAGALAFLGAVTALVLWNLRGRPWLAVGWFWFLGTLVPVIGLVQVGSQAMADRYMYVPLIGLSMMVAWGVPALIPSVRFRAPALAAASVVSVLLLGALCWTQASYWKDSITLYSHETALQPSSYFAHAQLGVALKKAGRDEDAQQEFLKTVAIMPGHMDANLYLALIAYGKKDYAKAIEYYTVAIDHSTGQRNRAEAEINFGVVLAAVGRMEDAAKHYQAGLQLRPNQPVAHVNLAIALEALGRWNGAMAHYRKALELQPGNAQAQAQLDTLLAKHPEAAAPESTPKLETAQDYYEYGNRLADQSRFARAAEQYEAALKLDPNFLNARINLGNAFAAVGRPREALAQFQETIERDPDNACALTNAGNALTELGQYSKAREAYNKALRANPHAAESNGLRNALAHLDQLSKGHAPDSKAVQ